jgi:hypothetical protein
MSTRETPIVPYVFWPEERKQPYDLPALIRATTLYGTPTTIRVRIDAPTPVECVTFKGVPRAEKTARKETLYCCPDLPTWDAFMAELSEYQRLLHALRDEVKTLPHYAHRRNELERDKVMTNPVCRSGICIAPVDKTWWNVQQPWSMTQVRRDRIHRHSMHNIWVGEGDGRQEGIYDWHCILREADWERVRKAHSAAKAAAATVEQRVSALGKYNAAAADRRYKDLKRAGGDAAETPMFQPKTKGQRKTSKRAGATT